MYGVFSLKQFPKACASAYEEQFGKNLKHSQAHIKSNFFGEFLNKF
jgi:hypothetical protein